MLDLGWSEFLLLGALALLLFGPRDMARLMRRLGRFAAQARESLWEIRRALEEADAPPAPPPPPPPPPRQKSEETGKKKGEENAPRP